MKFECNCKNERQFQKMLKDVRAEEAGWNFEIGARLWFTPDGFDKCILVEYQVATKECRKLTENSEEPDWLTAYEVESESEYDCSSEVNSDIVDSNIKLENLKDIMLDFAKRTFELCYEKEQDGVDSILDEAKQRSVSSGIEDNFEREFYAAGNSYF